MIKWEACLIGRMGSATSRTSWLNCGCVACCVAGHEVALAGFQMRNAVHGHYSLGVLARSSRPADTGPPLVLASFYLRGPAAHTGPLPDADPGEEAGLLSSSGDAAQAPALLEVVEGDAASPPVDTAGAGAAGAAGDATASAAAGTAGAAVPPPLKSVAYQPVPLS